MSAAKSILWFGKRSGWMRWMQWHSSIFLFKKKMLVSNTVWKIHFKSKNMSTNRNVQKLRNEKKKTLHTVWTSFWTLLTFPKNTIPPIPPNRQILRPLRPATSSAASERSPPSAFPPLERRTSGRVSSGRRGSISAIWAPRRWKAPRWITPRSRDWL